MPQKPYITEFEDYVLPDDQPENQNALSLEELGNVFGRIMAQNPKAADQVWSQTGFDAQTDIEQNEADGIAQTDEAGGSTLQEKNGDSVNDQEKTFQTEESPSDHSTISDGECPVTPESIFESILFVGNEENEGWVSASSVCGLIRNLSEEEVELLADRIQKRWKEDDRPYLLERDFGRYRMSLAPVFFPLRSQFYSTIRDFQLPQPAVNILAIVAYQQPITSADVESLSKERNATSLLNQLVRRGLLSVEKIGTGKKKTNLYRTTKRFLPFAGLESLDDLPTMEDI